MKDKTKKELLKEMKDLKKRVEALEGGAAGPGVANKKLELLASVVTESADAITVQDLSGRIMAWNRGAEKMYGYSETEALNMNVSAIVPDDRKGELSGIVRKMEKGEDCGFLQTKRITKDGKTLDVWLTVTRLSDDKGNITGLATSERDVTGHSRVLEELETALALAEQYTNDIERLVAERTASLIALNVADRIINPAVVIGVMCKRILGMAEVDGATRERLETILEESEKLQGIIHEFGSLVRRKQSMFRYDDLNDIVREAAVGIRAKAERRGVSLETELSRNPLMVNMNRNVLKAAVLYIFNNALEASSRGGTIKAVTSEGAESVSLVISDTGCGIPENNIEHIFDNFFTTKSNGIGMGLPFVKHIIEEHYGSLRIDSREKSGTTCTITFPVRWLKLSDGRLYSGHPMLPMSRESEEFPLQVKKDTEAEERN